MLGVVVLLALSAPGAEAPPATFPGGLLSPTGRTAFLRTGAGVLAVDLATGAELWSSAESHQPLFVAGDRLYSLARSADNELRVIGHDLMRRGARASRSEPVVLPRWAATTPREGHTFEPVASRRRHELVLDWHATARAERGPAKEARGRARIDLRTGQVRAEEAGEPAPAPPPPRVLEKQAVRWHRTLAGQVHALIAEGVPGGGQRLVLRGWELRSGKRTFARELVRGGEQVLLVGADNDLWLRDATPSPSRPGADEPRSWSVFSGVDGKAVARVPVLAGTREAVLLNGRAYLLTAGARRGAAGAAKPRHELHAYDLESGKVVWKKALER